MQSRGFNSQPPEGGWMQAVIHAQTPSCFNSQPPEGGWCILFKAKKGHVRFQLTAARRRLDSNSVLSPKARKFQLTAARRRLGRFRRPFADIKISFNSQPPEGGWAKYLHYRNVVCTFQLTAARRRLGSISKASPMAARFQLTAARRRLVGACVSWC